MTGSIAERAIQLAEQQEREAQAERDRVRRKREERELAERTEALAAAADLLGRVLEADPDEVRRQLAYVAHSRDDTRKIDAVVVQLDVPDDDALPLYLSLRANGLGAIMACAFDMEDDVPGVVCIAEHVPGTRRWEAAPSKLVRSSADLGRHLLDRRRSRAVRESAD